MMSLRRDVLSMYKRLLRVGRTWTAKSSREEDTRHERDYICTETREHFRKNQHLTDPATIRSYLDQAQSRLTIAMHYKIPYPRPVNLPPQTLAPKQSKWKGGGRGGQSKPT